MKPVCHYTRNGIAALLSCSVALCAWGQGLPDGGEPGLEATLVTEFSYDDNVLHQKTDETGSRVWLVNPQVSFAHKLRGTDVSLRYDLAHTSYLDSSVDTYTRHNLNYQLNTRLSKIHKLMLAGVVQSSYEPRGLNFSEGSNAMDLSAPTPVDTRNLTLSYQLGADAARLRAIASVGQSATDRESPLIVDDSRDYKADNMSAQILYRVGWRTDLVAEYRRQETVYGNQPQETAQALDSVETQTLVGVDLRATAKTTGQLRVGTITRKSVWKPVQWEDAPEATPAVQEDPFQAMSPQAQAPASRGADSYWELTGIWAPRTYSTFTLSSRVSNREPLFVGNYVRSRQHSLSWSHRWNGWIQSEMELAFGTDEYVGSDRVDDRQAVNLRLLYTLDSLMTIGLGMRHQKLDSNFGNAGFDKNIYYLHFNYTDAWGN